MASSDIEICNMSLSLCGVRKQIRALTDGSPEAFLSVAHYPQARDSLLSEVPWPFATKRATLTARTDPAELPDIVYLTRSGWEYSFVPPTDMLKARDIWTGSRTPLPSQKIPFAIEANDTSSGLLILCDMLEPELSYTARIEEVSLFPSEFVEALVWRLAARLVLPLAVKPEYARALEQGAAGYLARAIGVAFREGEEGPPPESEFITIRGG
jgi:hypothetical protein